MKKVFNSKIMYRFMIFIYGISFILILSSIVTELLTGDSIVANISSIKCPPFMKASVVFEVIKVVGFSNIFVGWIYKELDKKMLGLSYSDILYNQFYNYNFFSVCHITVTILCLAFAAAGLSESSLICLLLVLFGFAYQWNIAYCLILNSNKCENLAILTWQEYKKQTETLLPNLLCIAKTIPSNESKYYNSHLNCFSSLFIEFVLTYPHGDKLKQISEIWDSIINNENVVGNEHIFEVVFIKLFENIKSIEDIKFKNDCLCEISCGCLVSDLFKAMNDKKAVSFDVAFDKILQKYELLISELSKSVEDNDEIKKELFNCIKTNLFLLLWVYFQFDFLNLSKERLSIIPDEKRDEYFDNMINVLFNNRFYDDKRLKDVVSIARIQLKK